MQSSKPKPSIPPRKPPNSANSPKSNNAAPPQKSARPTPTVKAKSSSTGLFEMTREKWIMLGIAGACVVVDIIVIAVALSLKDDGGSDVRPTQTFGSRVLGSVSGNPVWTAPTTQRIRSSDRPPSSSPTVSEDARGFTLTLARGEFEPFQVLLGPGSGSMTVGVDAQNPLPDGLSFTFQTASFTNGGVAETLSTPAAEVTVALSGDAPAVVWVLAHANYDESYPAGSFTAALTLNSESFPVNIYIFDFLHSVDRFYTQLNIGISSLGLPSDPYPDSAKKLLFEHNFTPKSVPWPSGFGYSITWENSANPNQCSGFYDETSESDPYAIRVLGPRYILGEGDWNERKAGFPSAMAFQFVSNSQERPSTFCGHALDTSAYDSSWSQYLTGLQNYLSAHNMLEKSYYYAMNEPQDQSDFNQANALCRLTKAAAPNLRIAISEEPKPEIAEHADGACGYDIWIAHIGSYKKKYAWQRQDQTDEEVWFYSLDHDAEPFFNPTGEDCSGMDVRVISWAAYAMRITGWAYYSFTSWIPDGVAGIRAELLRDSIDDYNYLSRALERMASRTHPSVSATTAIDGLVSVIATSLTSWSQDPNLVDRTRYELGLYIEGSTSSLAIPQADYGFRTRTPYCVNFQNVANSPSLSEAVWEGVQCIRAGWIPFDAEKTFLGPISNDTAARGCAGDTEAGGNPGVGCGFRSQYVSTSSIALYGSSSAGQNVLENSFIYDDYGRRAVFEFAIPNGDWEVTVSCGYPGRGYSDEHYVSVEGTVYVDHQSTVAAENNIFTRTHTVTVRDGLLTVEFGGRCGSSSDFCYTFLQYMALTPVDS
eukprot:GCRY01003465.1.p1 GENE.GCRY01003465.1~~GCRY01003465.1.p1  ORF type:complete len:821 (+),score=183.59 GCRY01003465.1:195-2657(+)